MFNLESSITAWRRQMLAAGLQSPVPLDELEGHLREDIQQQMQSGLSAEQAFNTAVEHLGQANLLDTEFQTIERTFMKKTILIVAGLIGVAVGMAFVTPAVALYRHEGALGISNVILLLLGTALTLGGIGSAAFGFKKRKA